MVQWLQHPLFTDTAGNIFFFERFQKDRILPFCANLGIDSPIRVSLVIIATKKVGTGISAPLCRWQRQGVEGHTA